MAEYTINKFTYGGNTYKLKDDVSGYKTTDTDTNTWRNIKVNGTEVLSTSISSGAVNFKQGTGINITNSSGTLEVSSTVVNTDSKLALSQAASGTTLYPIIGSGTTAAERCFDTTGFAYTNNSGTTSSIGSSVLTLGNSTASGTAGNKQAVLRMYGSNAKYANITLDAPSADITLKLPTSGGTLALTSQIPTVNYPVTSVNSKTGAVSLTASDVSALPSNTTYVSTITTTAGTHSTISSKSGTVSFNVPTKTSHLTNDSGFITNAGVTGIKGNAESSYRTGQVNLTPTNLGAVDKAGDTMTGNLIVPAIRAANTYYGISFGRTTETPVETILYTGIKWIHGRHMPVVHVTGYAYGLTSPVEFKIGFYLYGDPICKVGWCGVTNMGSWSPEVYLFKYTRNSIEYVAVGFKGSCYFLQLQADLQDEMGKFGNVEVNSSFWSWSFLTTTGTIPTADGGTTCVQVPYKADILNPSKVNGHTVNADVPSNAVFTDTVTTATTTGSGNAVTAVTASNGALTVTKGTTFLTAHQDISGKADKSATVSNVAYDSTNAKITKTINGTTSDVVTVATLKTALGSMPASDVYSWAKASTKPTYTASEVGALPSNHTYTTSIATSSGTNQITLAHGTKYAITAGGTSYVFTMPSVGTIPSITLNGSSTTSPSFYAPTSAGTSGYYLKSSGSGAPTWTAFPSIPSGNILYGTTNPPSSSTGANGDIYCVYTS